MPKKHPSRRHAKTARAENSTRRSPRCSQPSSSPPEFPNSGDPERIRNLRHGLRDRNVNVRRSSAEGLKCVLEDCNRGRLMVIRKNLEAAVQGERDFSTRTVMRVALDLVELALNNHDDDLLYRTPELRAVLALAPRDQPMAWAGLLGHEQPWIRWNAAERLRTLKVISREVRDVILLRLLTEKHGAVLLSLATSLKRAAGRSDGPLPSGARSVFTRALAGAPWPARKAIAVAACRLHNLDDGDAARCIERILAVRPAGKVREVRNALKMVQKPGPRMGNLIRRHLPNIKPVKVGLTRT